MAANAHATQTPDPQPELPKSRTEAKFGATALTAPIHAYLERLSALHDEAAETALLANLLGRAPWAASAIGVAGIFTVITALKTMPSATLALWLALLAVAVSMTALVYGRANVVPFDRDALTTFARNLSAVLIFTGAAWGSGVALALPDTIGTFGIIFYVVGPSAALAAIVKARDISNCFIGPATATAVFGALTRGFDGQAIVGILVGGAAIVAASALSERLARPQTGTQEG